MARGTAYGAIDGLGGPSMAAILGPGDQFWGDHQWHDRSLLLSTTVLNDGSNSCWNTIKQGKVCNEGNHDCREVTSSSRL